MDEFDCEDVYYDDDCLDNECKHEIIELPDSDINVCNLCGLEQKRINFVAAGFNKHFVSVISTDKKTKNTITKIFIKNNYKLHDSIYEQINEMYKNIVTSPLFVNKGHNKNGIIGACLFGISFDNKTPITPKEILKLLKIDKKEFSNGMKALKLVYPEYAAIYIKSEDLVRSILTKIDMNPVHEEKIKLLIREVCKRNMICRNNSTPESVAAGVTLLYFRLLTKYNNIISNTESSKHLATVFTMSDKDFAQKVGLATVTLTKRYINALECLDEK